MTDGIPVTIHLDIETFKRLERIADRRETNMRSLIVGHLRASLGETTHVPTSRGAKRGVAADVIDEWERAARSGVTNTAIAERWGVSKALVSLRLRERGIRRHPHPRGSQR
jgi:hypothetical protein